MFHLAVQLARLCDRQGFAAVELAWVGTAVAEVTWGIAVGAVQVGTAVAEATWGIAVGAAWVCTAEVEATWGIAVEAEQHTVVRKLVVGMGVKLVVVERLRVLPHEFERGTWYCPQG